MLKTAVSIALGGCVYFSGCGPIDSWEACLGEVRGRPWISTLAPDIPKITPVIVPKKRMIGFPIN